MKLLLRTILIFLMASIITYLFFSFIKLDMNILNWEEAERFLMLLIAGIISAIFNTAEKDIQ